MIMICDIPHTPLDLTDFTTDTEEYAGLRDIECALGVATRLVDVPITRPNPDLRYLELRAQQRRAQKRAFRTEVTQDVQAY
ncbi:hypothetical protein IscW_ISCW008299 [Ixodes scapularis]|uniref:Uncharacterized protein n=1 Tax=Ixodes scapularis TaxID=6945 RepID=B7PSY5_IXOSC|nr:hypothetical protein IscW_ISCW008299 [Ixodes scapularis]|eukprot:XP_002403356.1 hypothetical protein IscW_ISCW008299 [Ixodes scapularis]